MDKRKGYINTKAIKEAIVFRQCPVTSGLPTSMTMESFKRLCARFVQGVKTDFGRKPAQSWCSRCQGKRLPRELTIIQTGQMEQLAKTHKKEQDMARKPQACEGCGKQKMLSNCSGELLCSSCAATAGSVSNRPEVVARLILKRGMSEQILEAMGVNQVASVAVESELLEKLSAMVGYEGESGDALFAEIERRVRENESLDEVCRSYDVIFDELFEVMGVERGKVSDLLSAIRAVKSEESVERQPTGEIRGELVAATMALSAICRALGLEDSDERLRYMDIAVGVAQVAAGLEQMERTIEDLATITDAVSFEVNDVVAAVCHSEALVEGMAREIGCTDTVRDWAMEAAEAQRILQQKELKIDLQTEQLSEAEQKLLADEQVFSRIREVIGADGAAPGDLPGAIETLITLSPEPRRNGNRNVDTHLLDLLTEFPQIGVERIAVLREAV